MKAYSTQAIHKPLKTSMNFIALSHLALLCSITKRAIHICTQIIMKKGDLKSIYPCLMHLQCILHLLDKFNRYLTYMIYVFSLCILLPCSCLLSFCLKSVPKSTLQDISMKKADILKKILKVPKKLIESIKERTIFLLDCIPDISVYNEIPIVNNMSVLPKGPQIKY